MKCYIIQYYSYSFVCVNHEKDVSKSSITDICVNNAIFSARSKNDKDYDNFICVSKAFKKESPILQIKNFLFCLLAK